MTIPRLLLSCSLLVASIPLAAQTHGAGPVLIAYGGFNETMAPMWVGVEKACSRNTASMLACCRLAAVKS